jgi:hypothetical protein
MAPAFRAKREGGPTMSVGCSPTRRRRFPGSCRSSTDIRRLPPCWPGRRTACGQPPPQASSMIRNARICCDVNPSKALSSCPTRAVSSLRTRSDLFAILGALVLKRGDSLFEIARLQRLCEADYQGAEIGRLVCSLEEFHNITNIPKRLADASRGNGSV